MTYFHFLFQFILLPLAILLLVVLMDGHWRKTAGGFLNRRVAGIAIGLHVLLAVVYTTPWDNYLVATGVWHYDPKLISGVILGWVPVEEYIFFVLETLFTGLWWWFVVRRSKLSEELRPKRKIRFASTAILASVWLLSVVVLLSGWKPATYLSLILTWALPAILLQLGFGADILWHYRKIAALAILPIFFYISAADSLAITSGTWTIDSAQSLGIFIGALPIEEALFFLVTVMIITFGLTLLMVYASQERRAAEAGQQFQINFGFRKRTVKNIPPG